MLPSRFASLLAACCCALFADFGDAAPSRLELRFAADLRIYDSDQGLPQNSVTALLRDRAGYLWIGTYGGLVRYDGDDFRRYGSQVDSGPPSDRITALLEDEEGRLWIGTENAGVGRMDPGERFVRPQDGCRDACRIRQLLRTDDGEVIAVGDYGAFRLDGQLQARAIAPAALGVVQKAVIDAQGGLWLADKHRILAPGATAAFALPDGGEVLRLLVDRRGVWAAGAAFWYLDPSAGPQPAPHGDKLPRVQSMARDIEGASWFGTESEGVWRIPAAGDRLQQLMLPTGLRNPVLLPAEEGAMWIGADGLGLMRWTPARVGGIGGPGSALASPTMALAPGRSGDLWIGAFCGGLHRLDAKGELHSFELPEVHGACVWSLAADGEGGVLAGYGRARVARIDVQGQSQLAWRLDGEPRVRALFLDANGVVWAGGSLGLYRGTLDGELRPVSAFGRAEVATIRPAADGGLWIGGDEGVVEWRDDRAVRRFGTAEGLGSRFVRSLYQDERGILWIGTYGGGLHRLEGDRLTRYTSADGLAEDFVSCIVDDGRGHLWLGGNRGLSRIERSALDAFDGRMLSSALFTRGDGMPVSETNGGGASACMVDAQGRLLFALISGVAVVDPARIRSREPVAGPRVDLVEARIDGHAVNWREGIKIDAGSSTLAVRYAAPSLAGGERIQFRYRLDGPWIEVGQTREILLSALPYGDWQLRLAARVDGGPWTAQPTTLAIFHGPPWHRDSRVGAALLLLASLLAAIGVRARTLALRERAARLDRLVSERTAELAEANAQLGRLARTDPLTGLVNRRGFAEHLERAWQEATLTGDPLALIAIDVDAFKDYNDGYGHPAGDACLQRVAALLRDAIDRHESPSGRGQERLLARIGGEEFIVLLRKADSPAAGKLAEALRRGVAEGGIRHQYSPVSDHLTISLGVAAMVPGAESDQQSLVASADRALYRAKLRGRDQVVMASANPDERLPP